MSWHEINNYYDLYAHACRKTRRLVPVKYAALTQYSTIILLIFLKHIHKEIFTFTIMLRRRHINIKVVKELDAFPKIPEDYRQQSAVGGAFSLASFCIIAYLIYAETSYFLDSRLQFKFEPDTEHNSHLEMNIDLTIAMPCAQIGADVVDSTNQNLITTDTLEEEETWWEMTPDQRAHFEALKHMNSYFREEYHAIHELLWKSNQLTFSSEMPKRTYIPSYPPDACRIYGTLKINKVAGNLHITYGKSLTLPRGHVHISAFMPEREYNFTHRINRFSFGSPSPGIIHPLEGEEKITTNSAVRFQYFIEVVSTEINLLMHKSKTYQYSVQDHEIQSKYRRGSHGLHGIFFNYDTSALKIKVIQERDSICQFLVKLCASIGCIFVTNGLLNSLVQNLWNILSCNFFNNFEEKTQQKLIVNNKTKEKVKSINLVNVFTPTSVDNVNIISKPQ